MQSEAFLFDHSVKALAKGVVSRFLERRRELAVKETTLLQVKKSLKALAKGVVSRFL